MSIRQRNGTWWVDFRAPSGERIRRSTGTQNQRAAQEYHDRLKAQLWRQSKLGEQPSRTFDEAALRFLQSCAGQSDLDSKRRYIKYWRAKLGGSRPIDQITADDVMSELPTHKVYRKRGAEPLSPATKNRYLATIRSMLRMAEDWEWIVRAPKLTDFKEPSQRIRWIPPEDATRLLSAITQPWMRDVSAFALATGMRAGEVLALEWSQVRLSDRTAWACGNQTKSGKARTIPLNDDAIAVIRRRIGTHLRYVFTRCEKRISSIDSRMFSVAAERSGIEDFHFHDLRHTWASWHAQAGTPLLVLKELGGWETLEMVKKYAHLAPSHLLHHADAVTFWAQQQAAANKNGNLGDIQDAVNY